MTPLERAKEQLNKWTIIVEYLESLSKVKSVKEKRIEIIKAAKPHWTQMPKNRARLKKIIKKMNKAKGQI